MNLKRMTEEQLWREYGRHVGFSALFRKEIMNREANFQAKKNTKAKKSPSIGE